MDRLITIAISHYCEKARWALQRANLPFEEEGHLPILHMPAVRRVGGKRSTPVLKTSTGLLTDSTDILRWVDQRRPGILFSEQRGEEEALEDRFDEQLGPATRRVAYFHLLPHRSLVLRLLNKNVPGWEVWFLRIFFPVAAGMMRRGLKIDAAGAERSLRKVRDIFAEVSGRLADGRPYLCGQKFSAVDLTFASLAAPLLLPPEQPVFAPSPDILPAAFQELVVELRATPAGVFALRMYREERARVL
jgi:glutathione S-transferase